MSTPGSTHTDETLPGLECTTELDESKALPALLAPDEDFLIVASDGERKKQSLPTAAPAVDEQPENIPLLGPVPSNFSTNNPGLAYDYLGKVKSLANDIKPGLYDTLFDQHFRRGCGKVELIGNGPNQTLIKHYGFDFWPGPGTRRVWNYDDIALVRTRMSMARSQDPCVLVVEAIDEFGIQALGLAFDVGPEFFARHLGDHQKERDAVTATRMGELSSEFAAYVTSRDGVQHAGNETKLTASHGAQTVYKNGVIYSYPSVMRDPNEWPLAGAGRRRCEAELIESLTPSISCCQVSQYGWLILADSAISLELSVEGPFHERRMLHWTHGGLLPVTLQCDPIGEEWRWRFKLAQNLEKALRAPPTRQLLFSSDAEHFDADWTGGFMSFVMATSAWQNNVLYFEQKLSLTRRYARENLSSETFEKLALLRRNVEDLERALLHDKKNISSTVKDAYEQRRIAIDSALPGLDEQYDALVQRTQALSNTLDSEIRLVIGSVTFQGSALMRADSAIMRKQAQRVTLLTILVAIYLPLTLVTGVFGMNIKEITDHAQPAWVCVPALIAAGGLTVAGILYYWRWQRIQGTPRWRPEPESKMYKMI